MKARCSKVIGKVLTYNVSVVYQNMNFSPSKTYSIQCGDLLTVQVCKRIVHLHSSPVCR